MAVLTINSGDLINIVDTLGCAKTRCHAIDMASASLDKNQRDALAWLAEDCQHIIDLAIDAIDALRIEEGGANG